MQHFFGYALVSNTVFDADHEKIGPSSFGCILTELWPKNLTLSWKMLILYVLVKNLGKSCKLYDLKVLICISYKILHVYLAKSIHMQVLARSSMWISVLLNLARSWEITCKIEFMGNNSTECSKPK